MVRWTRPSSAPAARATATGRFVARRWRRPFAGQVERQREGDQPGEEPCLEHVLGGRVAPEPALGRVEEQEAGRAQAGRRTGQPPGQQRDPADRDQGEQRRNQQSGWPAAERVADRHRGREQVHAVRHDPGGRQVGDVEADQSAAVGPAVERLGEQGRPGRIGQRQQRRVLVDDRAAGRDRDGRVDVDARIQPAENVLVRPGQDRGSESEQAEGGRQRQPARASERGRAEDGAHERDAGGQADQDRRQRAGQPEEEPELGQHERAPGRAAEGEREAEVGELERVDGRARSRQDPVDRRGRRLGGRRWRAHARREGTGPSATPAAPATSWGRPSSRRACGPGRPCRARRPGRRPSAGARRPPRAHRRRMCAVRPALPSCPDAGSSRSPGRYIRAPGASGRPLTALSRPTPDHADPTPGGGKGTWAD